MNIDHCETKARAPKSNGIFERFHTSVLKEYYMVAFRKKVYASIEELQQDLNEWLVEYNARSPHSGKYCD